MLHKVQHQQLSSNQSHYNIINVIMVIIDEGKMTAGLSSCSKLREQNFSQRHNQLTNSKEVNESKYKQVLPNLTCKADSS